MGWIKICLEKYFIVCKFIFIFFLFSHEKVNSFTIFVRIVPFFVGGIKIKHRFFDRDLFMPAHEDKVFDYLLEIDWNMIDFVVCYL